MEPLVSIILPVYNAAEHLPACLESLLKQKHQRLEIIAIDDNSKDSSAKILRSYRRMDSRIKVSTNIKRYGLAITLNRALRKVKGDYITFMNPYDVNSVWRIKKQLDFLRNNPRVVAVGTQTVTIDERGKPVEKTHLPTEHEHIYPSFLRGVSMQLETIMINRRLIPRDLLYFAQNTYPFVYIETFIKLFQYGKFANLMQHLYYHRGRPNAPVSRSKKQEIIQKGLLMLRSMTEYAYRPSIGSLLQPFTSQKPGLSIK